MSNRLSRVASELVKLNRRYRSRHISECLNNIHKPFWILFIGAQKELKSIQVHFPETKKNFPEKQKEPIASMDLLPTNTCVRGQVVAPKTNLKRS